MAKQKKRADGRLAAKITFDGKQYFAYGRTKAELEENRDRLKERLRSGKERHDNPTLEQYYRMWTDNRRSAVKEASLHCQQSLFRDAAGITLDTGRTFGQMKLSEISTDDIRQIQRELLANGRKTRTVNDILAHIKHVFKTAVDERRIDYNPCTLVKPLKQTEERARDTTHRALTKEETAAFLEAAKESYYYDVFHMAVNTGLRIGEIGALLTSDIKDGMITVERTITRKEDGSYQIGESAKTAAGRRTIPVNDTIREIIDHQTALNRAMDGVILHDRIFKAPERGLLMSTPVNREIKKICTAARIEYFSCHALRATFATRAIEQGINPRTVQELLGHSDFSITMNLYGHVLNETKKEAMQKLTIAI